MKREREENNQEKQNPYTAIYTSTIPSTKISVIFSVKEGIGSLSDCLQIIKDHKLNLSRIESRPSSKYSGWDYDFFADFSNSTEEEIKLLSKDLMEKQKGHISMVSHATGTIWFPRKMRDLDTFATKPLEFGENLETDHPGFTDAEYKKRRKEITEKAKAYKYGQVLPDVQYNEKEINTWKVVWTRIKELYPTHACKEYVRVAPLLEQHCGYGPNAIPQIRVVSEYLHDLTGWRIRPVTGLLTSRDFLNALAFRVFHSTQYVRHASQPLYTPEPDVCHELLGHVPLFADPDFADFSQEIGLSSLGATDEDILKLSTIYWFTVEFGICKENNTIKAYGAGLLSSFGELEYCLSGKPELKPFDPQVTALTKYPISQYQPVYFVTESFDHSTQQVREFARSMDRSFSVRYNPLTENIEVLDKKEDILRFSKSIQSDMKIMVEALEKLV